MNLIAMAATLGGIAIFVFGLCHYGKAIIVLCYQPGSANRPRLRCAWLLGVVWVLGGYGFACAAACYGFGLSDPKTQALIVMLPLNGLIAVFGEMRRTRLRLSK